MLSGLAFLNPWLLAALVTLPLMYWLMRAIPPRPQQIEFPPTRILAGIENEERTAETTPWWLTLIRLLAAAFLIFALADPILNPRADVATDKAGPVAIIVDNSWSAAAHWDDRVKLIDRLITDAEAKGKPVIILPTAAPATGLVAKVEAPTAARSTAAALQPQPFAPDRGAALKSLQAAITTMKAEPGTFVWLHDGIDHKTEARAFVDGLMKIAGQGLVTFVDGATGSEALAVTARPGRDGKLTATLLRTGGNERSGIISAFSARGERLAEAAFKFAAGATSTTADITLPLELRNQVARVEIAGEASAGAVSLIDTDNHWQRIGLVSGESREKAQPLLAPLYYIEKALAPYSEIVVSREANVAASVETVMKRNVSVLMLADIGTVSGATAEAIQEFVQRGGVLVRFAGPRLEKGGDELLPVALRSGGRTLGGALSWSTPQKLAAFDDKSIFSDLVIPADVRITRQVLAEPASMTEDVDVWARLEDGTPLVTATQRGEGQIVLFHITANSDWSNLPISGLFVEMLKRIAALGKVGSATAAGDSDATTTVTDAAAPSASILPPQRVLDGFGTLRPPPPSAEPVALKNIATLVPSLKHPPGYYGPPGRPRTVNVAGPKTVLTALPRPPSGVARTGYGSDLSIPLKPWLLLAATALVFADILAVLALQAGGLGAALSLQRGRVQRAATAAAIILVAALPLLAPAPAFAQFRDAIPRFDPYEFPGQTGGRGEAEVVRPGKDLPPGDLGALKATGRVTLAYVLTGDRETDTVSKLGLSGLGKVLTTRTTVEPDEPVGINILNDEIAFYPVLYWPVLDTAEALPDTVLAKIDAYMKQGGLIVFDTRDYGSGAATGMSLNGQSGVALNRLIGRLDLPRLEPVPENHVVTKSFYLLKSFPGRWDGGQLWVEANADTGEETRRARVSDGVTSVMITSNDLAAAWALDERGQPLYQTVPGGEMQREYAFRSGVNIVMHALTGNYKADQVHVPALLERLGQ